MDSVAAKAHKRVSELRKKIDILETQVALAEKFLFDKKEKLQSLLDEVSRFEHFIEIYNEIAEGKGHLPGHGFRNKNRQQTLPSGHFFRPGSLSEHIEKVVVKILSENKKALTIGKLLDFIEVREGKIITGARPRTALAAILSRSRKVYYSHPHGWTLTEEGREILENKSEASKNKEA